MCIVRVDALAQIGVILVGCALADSIGACEDTVAVVAGRCTGDNVDFERFTLGMELFGLRGYCLSYYFGRTGSGEAGKSTFGFVEKQIGCLFGSQDGKFHNFLFSELSGGVEGICL